jgi:hypothetical protein
MAQLPTALLAVAGVLKLKDPPSDEAVSPLTKPL